MVLGYSVRAEFEQLILQGVKIHTIRWDIYRRWKAGKLIHHAVGVRSKHYREFHRSICTGTQVVKFQLVRQAGILPFVRAIINGRVLTYGELDRLAVNDGFTCWQDMQPFAAEFCTHPTQYGSRSDDLVIVHWTDFRY